MPAAFHLSFWVADLARTQAFYVEVLGGSVGRGGDGWCDLDLFGHQVTVHQAAALPAPTAGLGAGGRVLDHFGVQLDRPAWQRLAEQVEAAGAVFRVRPRVERAGTPDERGKFVVVDPDGYGLEFKWTAADGGAPG